MQATDGPVGLVVAGAGARGAYEAGAIAALLPVLEERGQRPRVLVGTSAGSINVTLLAALADEPAHAAGEQIVAFWEGLTTRDVWRPLARSAPATVVRYLAELVGLPRPSLTSLLDTAPLRATAEQLAPMVERANRNIEAGLVDAVGVVATDVYRGRTAVFCGLAPGVALPASDEGRALDYLGGPLLAEHVMASSAIPLAFPAVEVPYGAAGATRWYGDGGVRLNAPLKPALDLGATSLVVVATHPADGTASDLTTVPATEPELDDHVVHLLDVVLVDRMVEDLRTLRTVNKLVRAADGGPGDACGYVEVPNLFVGPARREELGELALDVFAGLGAKERLSPTSAAAELGLLRRLLASTDGPRSGDLLSYLFFHPGFSAAAAERGYVDARQALQAEAPVS